jgi:nicotinic acid mononucleotide adenylyltransferase
VWLRGVRGGRCVVLLGAFDPPTRAHVAIARAAARAEGAPAVLCLTKQLLARPPGELLAPVDRLRLLDAVAAREGFGLVVANRGTYLDVGRALRSSGTAASFVVGSDKLEQLADPSFYADGESGVAATFSEFRFIVVPRPGHPAGRDDVRVMDARDVFEDDRFADISSTEVRRRVRRGEPVDAFVPPEVALGLGGYTAAK